MADDGGAEPTGLVSEGDVTMAGPGGAPQVELWVEERRARDRPDDHPG